VRNYVLSNTTQVFQASYQTHRVREDLLRLAFGPMAGRNDSLFQNLRNISLGRDADAPIDPSKEDLQEFEKRKDVRDLRASIEAAQRCGHKKEVNKIRHKLDNLIETLSCLRVEEKRAAYFNCVDRLRAQGLLTTDYAKECASKGTTSGRHGKGAEATVAQFMQICTSDDDECSLAEQRPKVYMELLVDYLASQPQPATQPGSESSTLDPDTDDGAEDKCKVEMLEQERNRKKEKRSRCLLCLHDFRSRSDLTKHC
jgi:hypothetical protein